MTDDSRGNGAGIPLDVLEVISALQHTHFTLLGLALALKRQGRVDLAHAARIIEVVADTLHDQARDLFGQPRAALLSEQEKRRPEASRERSADRIERAKERLLDAMRPGEAYTRKSLASTIPGSRDVVLDAIRQLIIEGKMEESDDRKLTLRGTSLAP